MRPDTFKAFLEVRLDVHGVLGLPQDLQQVIAGQEVEARELLTLVLQVVLQALLDALQFALQICEAIQHTWGCTCLHAMTATNDKCSLDGTDAPKPLTDYIH